jgi:aspartyl-tRNA(Asn)/glutamyl-tRNA(Gln) amidotransferase subunit A
VRQRANVDGCPQRAHVVDVDFRRRQQVGRRSRKAAGLLEDVSPMAYFGAPSLNAAFNVTGHPAISMCSGFSSDGLPLALQFIGKLFAEDELLRIAQAYESSTPWRQKRPDLSQFQS